MSGVEIERIARTEEERTFRVNGTPFMFRPAMHARKLAAFQDAIDDEGLKGVAFYDLAIQFIRDALEPGFVEEWNRVTDEDSTSPISMYDMEQILSQSLAAASGRPFEKPQDSGTT